MRSSTKINTFGIQHHAAPSMDFFKSKEVNLTNNVFDHTKIINTTTGEHSSQNMLDSQDGGNWYKEDRRSGVKYGSTILKNEDMLSKNDDLLNIQEDDLNSRESPTRQDGSI